jgi:hypothetical protein
MDTIAEQGMLLRNTCCFVSGIGPTNHPWPQRKVKQVSSDYGAQQPRSFLLPLIHRSAWKANSTNFALTEF